MTAPMTPAELLAFVQSLPPQVMQEMSRAAVHTVTEALAAKLEEIARDPAMRATTGDVALRAAVATIRGINQRRYGGTA